ncbi:MAG: hypothetical protein HXS44_01715 [Theionarchaea archaeon]|nr:hypothetical protein [Theionarchaea archaeon]
MEKQSVEYTDERFVQEVKTISREIVKEIFPDEEEYFDFLFELIMPELEEMGRGEGEREEFLKEIRGVHPLAVGCTAVITVVFQVLAQYRYYNIEGIVKKDLVTEEKVEKIITNILGDGEEHEEFSGVPRILMQYIEKAKSKVRE